MPDPATRVDRLVALDYLRGIAVILVFGRHIPYVPASEGTLLFWRQFGWIGVDLFFVLSGFLVGGILLREVGRYGLVQPTAFLIRRGLKIYPAFYVFIAASLTLAYFRIIGFRHWPGGIWGEIFFLQNYAGGLWDHTWSLAIEEHFYLALLLLFIWLCSRGVPKEPLRNLPGIVLGINMLVLLGRLAATHLWQIPWTNLHYMTHWRIDSLLFGVLLSYGYHFKSAPIRALWVRYSAWQWVGLPVLLAPCIVLNVERDLFVRTFGYTCLYLGFGWIVLDVLYRDYAFHPRIARAFGWLAGVGRHSYSIYLWHLLIFDLAFALLRTFGQDQLSFKAITLIAMIAAVLWGAAMSKVIEQPVLAWRNRLFPSRSGTVPAGRR